MFSPLARNPSSKPPSPNKTVEVIFSLGRLSDIISLLFATWIHYRYVICKLVLSIDQYHFCAQDANLNSCVMLSTSSLCIKQFGDLSIWHVSIKSKEGQDISCRTIWWRHREKACTQLTTKSSSVTGNSLIFERQSNVIIIVCQWLVRDVLRLRLHSMNRCTEQGITLYQESSFLIFGGCKTYICRTSTYANFDRLFWGQWIHEVINIAWINIVNRDNICVCFLNNIT